MHTNDSRMILALQYLLKQGFFMLVLITGGGGGLGSEMAAAFAENKYDVALIDINRKALKRTEARIKGLGVKCRSYAADVRRLQEVKRVCNMVKRDLGSVDILVNNAALLIGADFADTPASQWRRIIEVNIMGYVNMQQVVLPGMLERGSGHIVNISSSAGLMALPAMSAYCASKFAISGMTESLHTELRGRGIRVSLACPAFVRTGMLSDSAYVGYDERFAEFMLRVGMEPGRTAARIVKKALRGRFLIHTSLTGRLGYYTRRVSPWLYMAVMRIMYRIMQGWKTGGRK
ncbi:MAG: SDR family oxidoreductase [Spirochaetes bacterium]|nr:SDR family oxidoreductase [Spirochaetota bacterium]